MAQEEWGWLSVNTMDYVASLLNLEPIEVYEVATFLYDVQFKTSRKICVRSLPNRPLYVEGL